MRLLDHDEPIDPEIAETLDAIDAVLAGEPVDARHAEVAEIALLLASERPAVPAEFGRSMDTWVARRFEGAAAPNAAAAAVGRRRPKRVRLSRGFWEGTAALATGVALIVALVVFVGHHNGASSESSSSAPSGAVAASSTSASSPPAASAGSRAPSHRAALPLKSDATTSGAASSAAATASTPAPTAPPNAGAARSSAAPTLQPPTTGRKVVQGAQLNLGAPANRIDDVAQQVYNVIGDLGGIVQSSTVTQTGGLDGYAQFQLSVPSASLGTAMGRLSSLNYATVTSRTDTSQDITDQYGATQRALADARALRTSLLKQLAGATTTDQVNSLNAQIHDAESSISSDEATLARFNHQVDFSQLSVEIAAQPAPAPVAHHSGGFGVGSAAHDAGRVLTVAAGVSLIALAALTPVALLVALVWWVGSAITRRRREQALDAA